MEQTFLSEPKITKKKKSRTGKLLARGILILVLVFITCYIVLALFSPEGEEMPFFQAKEAPLVIAHQGGNQLSPSSTIVGFDRAVELGVDVLEYDLHMTKDGHLVLIHDPTVDRTTNGQGRVEDLTLAEIQALDAGYTFQDLEGAFSFRDQGVYIPTLEEMFQRYGDMLHNIEMKDTNSPENYNRIYHELWRLIETCNMEDKVLVVSFDQQMVQDFQQISEGRVAVSGGRKEITKFVVLNKLFLGPFYKPTVQAVQMPTESDGFNLADSKLIRGAARQNMHLHYWTINDVETMRELLDLGADGIITDRPDLLLEIIEEYREKRRVEGK